MTVNGVVLALFWNQHSHHDLLDVVHPAFPSDVSLVVFFNFCINKHQVNDVALLVRECEWAGKLLHLSCVVRNHVVKLNRLEDVRLLEGAVDLYQHVVPL